jgi:ribonuclease HII
LEGASLNVPSCKSYQKSPTFNEEKALISQGYKIIAGIDEAGRGALAGPVVAAAVTLPQTGNVNENLKGARDSKLMTPLQRERLFHIIIQEAVSFGVGIISPDIIDLVNILNATRQAMRHAIEQMSPVPDYLLVDGMILPGISLKQKAIIKGDRLCLSIACASIVAKVTRDHIMVDADKLYPGYGFACHKGYGTKLHVDCLCKIGPARIHRYTFMPVRQSIRLI